MSDFDLEELNEALDKTRRSRVTARRAMLALAFTVLVLLGLGAAAVWLATDNARLATAARGYGVEQQQEKQNLAQEFDDACKSADFKSSAAGSNICRKAEQVASEPGEPMAGPQGVQGIQGMTGKDGVPGIAGADGLPGPAGIDGAAGADGADSTIPGPPGLTGAPGADSTVPGPAGPQGAAGPAGADGAPGSPGAAGTSPTSITFTDKTGTTYTCTPNPPGSSTYTCTSDGKTP